MERQNQHSYAQDEFDIEVLVEKLYRIFKRGLRKIWMPFRYFGAKPVVSIAWLVAAIIMAFVLTKALDKVYEGSFTFRPIDQGDLVFIGILYDAQTLLKNGDVEVLARELKIDPEDLHKLKNFDFEIIWKTKAKDTVNAAYVTLRATDPALFSFVQDGMMAYLESNIHYSRSKALRQQENEILIRKLDQELSQIDSLKHFLMEQTSPREGAGFVYGEPPEMITVYHASVGFFTKQVGYLMDQNKDYSFELLKPVVAPTKPVFPKFAHLLALGLIIAFVGAAITNYRLINRPLA